MGAWRVRVCLVCRDSTIFGSIELNIFDDAGGILSLD